ncbi:MAG TPA: hypothetical protein VFE50_26825 [Cyclobacteriaceae bacterium]|nr:hypothetical protein [Cyclobacteriaceae bacterium]
MTKSLKNADHLAKILLAVCVIIFYAMELIRGPFALALFILACVVILTLLARIAFKWITMD